MNANSLTSGDEENIHYSGTEDKDKHIKICFREILSELQNESEVESTDVTKVKEIPPPSCPPQPVSAPNAFSPESEKWKERNVVLTRLDHTENVVVVQEIVSNIIDDASKKSVSWSPEETPKDAFSVPIHEVVSPDTSVNNEPRLSVDTSSFGAEGPVLGKKPCDTHDYLNVCEEQALNLEHKDYNSLAINTSCCGSESFITCKSSESDDVFVLDGRELSHKVFGHSEDLFQCASSMDMLTDSEDIFEKIVRRETVQDVKSLDHQKRFSNSGNSPEVFKSKSFEVPKCIVTTNKGEDSFTGASDADDVHRTLSLDPVNVLLLPDSQFSIDDEISSSLCVETSPDRNLELFEDDMTDEAYEKENHMHEHNRSLFSHLNLSDNWPVAENVLCTEREDLNVTPTSLYVEDSERNQSGDSNVICGRNCAIPGLPIDSQYVDAIVLLPCKDEEKNSDLSLSTSGCKDRSLSFVGDEMEKTSATQPVAVSGTVPESENSLKSFLGESKLLCSPSKGAISSDTPCPSDVYNCDSEMNRSVDSNMMGGGNSTVDGLATDSHHIDAIELLPCKDEERSSDLSLSTSGCTHRSLSFVGDEVEKTSATQPVTVPESGNSLKSFLGESKLLCSPSKGTISSDTPCRSDVYNFDSEMNRSVDSNMMDGGNSAVDGLATDSHHVDAIELLPCKDEERTSDLSLSTFGCKDKSLSFVGDEMEKTLATQPPAVSETVPESRNSSKFFVGESKLLCSPSDGACGSIEEFSSDAPYPSDVNNFGKETSLTESLGKIEGDSININCIEVNSYSERSEVSCCESTSLTQTVHGQENKNLILATKLDYTLVAEMENELEGKSSSEDSTIPINDASIDVCEISQTDVNESLVEVNYCCASEIDFNSNQDSPKVILPLGNQQQIECPPLVLETDSVEFCSGAFSRSNNTSLELKSEDEKAEVEEIQSFDENTSANAIVFKTLSASSEKDLKHSFSLHVNACQDSTNFETFETRLSVSPTNTEEMAKCDSDVTCMDTLGDICHEKCSTDGRPDVAQESIGNTGWPFKSEMNNEREYICLNNIVQNVTDICDSFVANVLTNDSEQNLDIPEAEAGTIEKLSIRNIVTPCLIPQAGVALTPMSAEVESENKMNLHESTMLHSTYDTVATLDCINKPDEALDSVSSVINVIKDKGKENSEDTLKLLVPDAMTKVDIIGNQNEFKADSNITEVEQTNLLSAAKMGNVTLLTQNVELPQNDLQSSSLSNLHSSMGEQTADISGKGIDLGALDIVIFSNDNSKVSQNSSIKEIVAECVSESSDVPLTNNLQPTADDFPIETLPDSEADELILLSTPVVLDKVQSVSDNERNGENSESCQRSHGVNIFETGNESHGNLFAITSQTCFEGTILIPSSSNSGICATDAAGFSNSSNQFKEANNVQSTTSAAFNTSTQLSSFSNLNPSDINAELQQGLDLMNFSFLCHDKNPVVPELPIIHTKGSSYSSNLLVDFDSSMAKQGDSLDVCENSVKPETSCGSFNERGDCVFSNTTNIPHVMPSVVNELIQDDSPSTTVSAEVVPQLALKETFEVGEIATDISYTGESEIFFDALQDLTESPDLNDMFSENLKPIDSNIIECKPDVHIPSTSPDKTIYIPRDLSKESSVMCQEGLIPVSESCYTGEPTYEFPDVKAGENFPVPTSAVIKQESTTVNDRPNSAAGEIINFTEEEFKSAAVFFKEPSDFEFLQKAGNSKAIQESQLGRLSLFFKFDPLLSGSPKKEKKKLSFGQMIPEENIDVVDEMPRFSTALFTSPEKTPAITGLVDDVGHSPEVLKLFSEEEYNKALYMQNLIFEDRLIKQEQEFQKKVQAKQQEIESTKNAIRVTQECYTAQRENLVELLNMFKSSMKKSDDEQMEIANSNQKLRLDRDQALEDLRNVEKAFSDLVRRYEVARSALETMKKNEKCTDQQIQVLEKKIEDREKMTEMLRTQAEEKLEMANKCIEEAKKSKMTDIAVVKAMLRKADMKIRGLEKNLENIGKENTELSSIYDDLMAKVS